MLQCKNHVDIEDVRARLESLCDSIIETASNVTAEADAFLKCCGIDPAKEVIQIEVTVKVVPKTPQNDELLLNG
jgi:hypothetical protein